ncbi:Na+/H+ antiporter [Rurimicrobium arvi]|uniref:Na+/H+ antiporter n=1 Tax=Rurimicrobium arvi TaxID=2049916 RepID=A0ABP8N1K5_9BACT
MLIMLANTIRVAYPVILVVAGLLISFFPGVPVLHMDPELIFALFLPPLLYEAAWVISWRELWRWRRIIGSFAFVVVFLTAMSVAFVANKFIPGFSLALGFLLGGIVSPPDAVSASAILKFVKVPRRMSSILEGESLLNDASSLIIFRFALISVGTGQFIWHQAALSFVWMVVGGVGIGLLVGWMFMMAHKKLPTDANMDIIMTIITPYFIYIVAEEVHSSGVLAVVSGGLFLSHFQHRFLSSTSRLRGVNVWQSFVFVLNGLVFLLIGLELPEITAGLRADNVSFNEAIGYGLLITALLILGRILSAYGAVIVTIIARNFIKVADPNPGFKGPLLLGWTGMRGVVSLAAALSIPVQLSDGSPFPHRNLILFITFVVILTTLLLQGLTLPLIIRRMKLGADKDYLPEEEAHETIRKGLARNGIHHLQTDYAQHLQRHKSLQQMAIKWNATLTEEPDPAMSAECKAVCIDLLERQRVWLLQMNRDDQHLDEEMIRAYLRQIDIEEEKLRFL